MNSESWSLHPQLVRDTIELGDLALSRVLVIKDANYPWLLLVPRRRDIVELIDLDEVEQAQLMVEINRAAACAQDGHGMRQAQYRGAGQRSAAASCAYHRAPQDRQGLAEAGLGAGAARSITISPKSIASWPRCARNSGCRDHAEARRTALGPWPALGYIDSIARSRGGTAHRSRFSPRLRGRARLRLLSGRRRDGGAEGGRRPARSGVSLRDEIASLATGPGPHLPRPCEAAPRASGCRLRRKRSRR